MLRLDGILKTDLVFDIKEYVDLRFDNQRLFLTPEAMALHEQRILSDDKIKALCEDVYGFELFEPVRSYIPKDIIEFFRGSGYVPVNYQPMKKIVTVVYLHELKHTDMPCPLHQVVAKPTTIYYYMQNYQKCYGVHKNLRDIPTKILFDNVIKEAINLNAADITISNFEDSTIIYYNVRKKKVHSNYLFSKWVMNDLLKMITVKSPLNRDSRKPKMLDIDLNGDYRGRVLINYKSNGYTITIRLLPNEAFNTDITSLNLTAETEQWLIDNILDSKKGLRLIVGETMSGKNTTALALLKQLVEIDRYKVASVELPVEQKLVGVEQINCENIDDYAANIQSLIRMNPDFVYITEIQDKTGLVTVQVSNTGKCVLSTLHANSVADTIPRLVDITGLSQDRIIQSLHSIVYQELIRDDEKDIIYPRNKYLRFTNELKYRMYGKSLGEVLKIIQEHEEGDVWTYSRRMTQ